jgi:uncharacterized membrane protein YozB (DUF420 family)
MSRKFKLKFARIGSVKATTQLRYLVYYLLKCMLKYCHVFSRCGYRRGMDRRMDLLTIFIHHSELQVITAPLPVSTIHRSPQHPLSSFPACCVFNSLAMASNNGDYPPSSAHVITVRRISRNWTHSADLGFSLYSHGAHLNRKHCFQQSVYCCYGQLPSDSPDIVDVFTGRYQATHVPSRDRCLARVLQATIYFGN